MDTIIIDDENKALDILQFYLENYFSDYNIRGRFTDIHEALEGILKMKPAIVFLDISMPSGSGIELLSRIKHLNCFVVFLTAHSEYAIEAIKLDAFDYLLKPINLSELNRVDSKIREKRNSIIKKNERNIKIQISKNVYLYETDDIIYASSQGNYTTIYAIKHKPLIITKNIKKIEIEFFSDLPFFRSHQSFIVNINHIVSFSNFEIILINEHKAQLSGKSYDDLTKLLR